MSDDIWRRPEIESPCVKICVIHPDTRLCVGCRRTGDEIAAWSRLTPEERRAIMADLPSRPEGPGRRGGSRARRQG
ncbi:DUF1289 domain-containing protein [Halovulum dunhuangense]|uniref:DUF1289 domain-containing protein n=1 Tax=Halovulum dunhuangense TaxID=1505036 RepID=A0A849L3Q2_9RHOB|nr:DUF1289 domain-containing protein [Halovulum dunhuangense]NNU81028.1 DUF1289 domain-containing protein [Halovulum dunhuangense]